MAKAQTKSSSKHTTAPAADHGNEIIPERRYRMIAEAAYYIAEKRDFTPGDHAKDWAEAEAQIDAMLNC